MTKVYPNQSRSAGGSALALALEEDVKKQPSPSPSPAPSVLTVWNKSLLFNCTGFTVFDVRGNLLFRVDNYVSGTKDEIVLMDAAGKPLLTIRRKRLNLVADTWLVYDGETDANPRFAVKKRQGSLSNSKSLAHVNASPACPRGAGAGGGGSNGKSSKITTTNVDKQKQKQKQKKELTNNYEIEGSYGQRCCAIYDDRRRCVAEIRPKEAVGGVAFGVDVFRLIVQPELDTTVAMALVILLDQMFGSASKRFSGFSSTH